MPLSSAPVNPTESSRGRLLLSVVVAAVELLRPVMRGMFVKTLPKSCDKVL